MVFQVLQIYVLPACTIWRRYILKRNQTEKVSLPHFSVQGGSKRRGINWILTIGLLAAAEKGKIPDNSSNGYPDEAENAKPDQETDRPLEESG
jgi:hypothetical protein